MKKIIIGAFAIIAVSAAFILVGCEKEEGNVQQKSLVYQGTQNLTKAENMLNNTIIGLIG